MSRSECEQHYTPARDNQYRATARYYKECCPYCEIDRLKRELEEARVENSHLWVRVESGEAAAYEQGKAEARQEAAREADYEDR